MKNLFLTIMSFVTLVLTACSTDGTHTDGMSPEPPSFQDLTDGQLRIDVLNYLKSINAPNQSQYSFVRADLNGDHRRDALVLFHLPHHHWCGWGGCTMSVFRAGAGQFMPLGDIRNIRGPLVIADTRTGGWNDLIVELSGSNLSNRLTILSFDGHAYPANPMNAPSAPYGVIGDVTGMKVF